MPFDRIRYASNAQYDDGRYLRFIYPPVLTDAAHSLHYILRALAAAALLSLMVCSYKMSLNAKRNAAVITL